MQGQHFRMISNPLEIGKRLLEKNMVNEVLDRKNGKSVQTNKAGSTKSHKPMLLLGLIKKDAQVLVTDLRTLVCFELSEEASLSVQENSESLDGTRVLVEIDKISAPSITEEIKLWERTGLLSVSRFIQYEEQAPEEALENLIIMLTNACNLSCDYCYRDNTNITISRDDALWGIHFLLEQPGQTKTLGYLGGEPFIRFDLMNELSHYGIKLAEKKGKEIKFTIATNGTVIKREHLRRLPLSHCSICVSIDGEDSHRVWNNGRDSYDDAVKGIQLLLDEGINPSVRATITPDVIPIFDELIEKLGSLGVDDIHVIPVMGSVDKVDTQDIENSVYEKSLKVMKEFKTKQLPAQFISTLSRMHYLAPKKKTCKAGFEIAALSYDGFLYPCGTFALSKEQPIGRAGYGFFPPLREEWASFLNNFSNSCSSCAVKTLCSGCPAEAYFSRNENRDESKVDDFCCNYWSGVARAGSEFYSILPPEEKEEFNFTEHLY